MDEVKRGRREAEERLAQAAAQAENVQAMLMEAIEALRDAKKEANETMLEGIKEPLVDYFIQTRDFESLSLLVRTCRSTQESVAARIRKLVFRFQQDNTRGDGATCLLGQLIEKFTKEKYKAVQHLVAVDRVGTISLAGAPSAITTFEVKHEKKATTDSRGLNAFLRGKGSDTLKKLTVCPSLQTLLLRDCKILRCITNLAACSALQELDLSGCSSLHLDTLKDLESCTGLRKLCFEIPEDVEVLDCNLCKVLDPSAHLSISCRNGRIQHISQLADYPALKEVSIKLCHSLPWDALKVLNSCTGLEKLYLQDRSLEALPILEDCTALRVVQIDCWNLMDVSALAGVTALQELEIKGGKLKESTSGTRKTLEKCRGLRKLDISDCKFGLPDLRNIPNLEVLHLSDSSIDDISSVNSCTALRELSVLSDSLMDNDLEGLKYCTTLQKLKLGGGLAICPDLAPCAGLEVVEFSSCKHLFFVRSIALSHASLRHASFVSCEKVLDCELAHLKYCTRLESLSLDNLPLFSEFPDLKSCTKLRYVSVANCPVLKDVFQLANLPALSKLRLENCPALTNDAFRFLGVCIDLESLTLVACPQLRDVPNFLSTKLRVLNFVSCEALKNICLLASCRSIRELSFSGRNSVSKDTLLDLRECCKWIWKVTSGKLEMF